MKKILGLFLFNYCLANVLLGADGFQKLRAKPADLSHDKNLYVVGYAHLDTQWRWTYPTTIQENIRNTLEQNFPLIEKYPNYIFNFTGSRRYEFMQEYYPEGFERVKKYVQAGRWYPGGSSVDENDANIPSLESFVRQTLYGNHYFKREFGIQSDDYLLPDCFGFPASLPTIFAHEGLKGFSTQKLTWGYANGAPPFSIGTWVGPDGSSVIAALNPGGYGARVDEDLSKNESWLKRINETGGKSGVFADYKYYGTGDRGGSPSDGSVNWIERALASDGPVRVISATSDEMYNDIIPEQAAKLPAYKGDLLLVNHSAGSLSSEAYMKHWNRENEQLANAAESAATIANWLGIAPYPQATIYAGWDLVLGSQMHDIMPGTSLPRAYEYAWNDEVLALNQFADVLERSSAAVLSTLDTTAKGVAVAVYNPLPIEREDAVEATVTFAGVTPDAVTAYDPQGNPVPTQILGHDGNSFRVLFVAKAPSVGYAVYDLRPETNSAPSTLTVTDKTLENARYKVSVNAAGDIASIFDKSLNRELLSTPARLSFHYENPSAWPAWNMDWEDREKPARDFVGGAAQIRIVEDGPARVALEIKRTTENSTFTQQIRLAAGSGGDRVEILNKIDWRSMEASLKADFNFTAANANAVFADKVGVSLRDNDKSNRFEMPLQQWLDLTDVGGGYGVEVISDSKYGSDKPDNHTLRLTLLYTPGTRGGYPDQGTQDQGRHEILYALAGHKGDWAEGRDPWQAARVNEPLRAFLSASHSGNGRTFSLLTLNSDQVLVEAVKKAEDSDEIIVRLQELNGQPANNLSLRFPVAIKSAREVNGQEAPIGNATIQDGQLNFSMKPFGLKAFALKLASPKTAVARVTSKIVPLDFDTDVVSSRANRTNGTMNSQGWTYPAEMFPKEIVREGIKFQFGSVADGKNNALTAHGQTIQLPSGNFNRVHLLVAADGDTTNQIQIGADAQPFNVPDWTGYIGQWDNRIWNNPTHKRDFEANQPPIGLVPGFIKRTPVAWFATHHNTPQGDAYYNYSYLFELTYDLPAGTENLTLPDNSKNRVFAVSVASEPTATPPAAPLYETLADHQFSGVPIIPQAGKTFNQAAAITLLAPLYHRPGDLHYTLDGSDPTASSPAYSQPFMAEGNVKIAVAQIDENGHVGSIVRGEITINDLAPPKVVSTLAEKNLNALDLVFSKPLDSTTAVDAKNYSVQPALTISKVTQSDDGRTVTLTFDAPIPAETDFTVSLSGIKDKSANANVIAPIALPFNAGNIVYTLKSAQLPSQSINPEVAGLPLRKNDAWTINLLVKPDQVTNRAIIAGFGQNGNNRNAVTGRFFSALDGNIVFGSGRRGVRTGSPLEAGRWQMLTATYDGTSLTVYKDGDPIGNRDVEFSNDAEGYVNTGAPASTETSGSFSGAVQNFTIRRGAFTDAEVKQLFANTKAVP